MGSENWPSVGVIGIAGEVKNNRVNTTNIPHWAESDGALISKSLKIPSFTFINDFKAAGYGICLINKTHYEKLNDVEGDKGGVKVVMGPGTGLGQGILVKSAFSPCYEVFPSEGGHVDFPARSDEDWRLVKHAINFIEDSENVEN